MDKGLVDRRAVKTLSLLDYGCRLVCATIASMAADLTALHTAVHPSASLFTLLTSPDTVEVAALGVRLSAASKRAAGGGASSASGSDSAGEEGGYTALSPIEWVTIDDEEEKEEEDGEGDEAAKSASAVPAHAAFRALLRLGLCLHAAASDPAASKEGALPADVKMQVQAGIVRLLSIALDATAVPSASASPATGDASAALTAVPEAPTYSPPLPVRDFACTAMLSAASTAVKHGALPAAVEWYEAGLTQLEVTLQPACPAMQALAEGRHVSAATDLHSLTGQALLTSATKLGAMGCRALTQAFARRMAALGGSGTDEDSQLALLATVSAWLAMTGRTAAGKESAAVLQATLQSRSLSPHDAAVCAVLQQLQAILA